MNLSVSSNHSYIKRDAHIASFPKETLTNIFSYLFLSETVRFAAANKSLYPLLKDSSPVAATLDNSTLYTHVPRLIAFAGVAGANLKRLSIESTKKSELSVLIEKKPIKEITKINEILDKCSRIEEFKISSLCLKKLHIADLLSIFEKIKSCHLRSFECLLKQSLFIKHPNCLENFHSLQIVSINACIQDQTLSYFTELPLKKLDLSDCEQLTEISFEYIGTIQSLRSLRLCRLTKPIMDTALRQLQHLRDLKALQLSGNFTMTVETASSFDFSQLQFLEWHSRKISPKILLAFLSKHVHLAHLFLEIGKLTENDIFDLTTLCPNLRSIKLLNAGTMTEVFMSEKIFASFSRMKCLEALAINERVDKKRFTLLSGSSSLKFLDVGEETCHQPTLPSKILIRSRLNSLQVRPLNFKSLKLL